MAALEQLSVVLALLAELKAMPCNRETCKYHNS